MKKNQHNFWKIFQPTESLSEKEIKNYLQEEVSDEERFRIENRIIDSPLDADAVDGFGEMGYDFSKKKPYADFQTFMEGMEKDSSAKIVKLRPKYQLFRRLAVAASFLLLIAAGTYVYNSTNVDGQALFANNFVTYKNDLPSFRGGVDDEITIMQTFDRAMEAYSNGNYAESLPFFKEYLTNEPDSHFAMFYSGLAYLEIENTEDAILMFEKAITQEDDNYRVKAEWFLALAHLKNGNTLIAQQKLEEYVRRGAKFKKEEAKKLLIQIVN